MGRAVKALIALLAGMLVLSVAKESLERKMISTNVNL